VVNHRVEYDMEAVERRFERTNLHRWLLERLRMGV